MSRTLAATLITTLLLAGHAAAQDAGASGKSAAPSRPAHGYPATALLSTGTTVGAGRSRQLR